MRCSVALTLIYSLQLVMMRLKSPNPTNDFHINMCICYVLGAYKSAYICVWLKSVKNENEIETHNHKQVDSIQEAALLLLLHSKRKKFSSIPVSQFQLLTELNVVISSPRCVLIQKTVRCAKKKAEKKTKKKKSGSINKIQREEEDSTLIRIDQASERIAEEREKENQGQ